MGLRLITAPAVEPITVADVNDHLRIADPAEATVISRLIRAAREWAEQYQGRRLITSTWNWTLDRFPRCGRTLRPYWGPLQSIDSITYRDANGVTQQLAEGTDYDVDVADPPRIVPVGDWPDTDGRPAAVTIQYTAGYGAHPEHVPAATQMALLQLVGHWYENREACAMQDVPAHLLAALDNDRSISLGQADGL